MSIVGNFLKGTGSLLGEVSKCLVKGSADLVGNVAEELNAHELAGATKKAGEATGDLLEMVGKGAGDVLGNVADIVTDKVTELSSEIMEELKRKPDANTQDTPYTQDRTYTQDTSYTENTSDSSCTQSNNTAKDGTNTTTVYYDLPEVYESSSEDVKEDSQSDNLVKHN